MKLAITLIVIAIICVAGMDYVIYHSFPNPDILPANVEVGIREIVFYLSLCLTPIALVMAIRAWLLARKEISPVRSGLGLTSLLFVSTYCILNFVSAVVIQFRLWERFDTTWLVEWDFRSLELLLLAILLSVSLKRVPAMLIIACAILEHAFIKSNIYV